jgi:hypothetical protein
MLTRHPLPAKAFAQRVEFVHSRQTAREIRLTIINWGKLMLACIRPAFFAMALMTGTFALAADELPYKEGTVLEVSSIKIKDGKFYDYWTFLNTSWRQEMEAAKKQGLVLSYAVYGATPKRPSEPDLYLVVEYPNMAVFDGMDEKMLAIDKQIWGTIKSSSDKQAERDSIRTILGSEIIRELKFK